MPTPLSQVHVSATREVGGGLAAALLLCGFCAVAYAGETEPPVANAPKAVHAPAANPPADDKKHDDRDHGDHDRHHGGDKLGDAVADVVMGAFIDVLLSPAPDPSPNPNPDRGLAPDTAAALRGEGLDGVVYPPPPLYAGISLWDVLSGDKTHGEKMAQQNGLTDPGADASRALTQAMTAAYAMSPAPSLPDVADDDPSTLEYLSAPGRYVLSVRTLQWGVERYTTRPGRYYVELSLRLRLVDVREHALLAQGSCEVNPDYDGEAPTKGELLADQGALLKKLLQTDVDKCVANLGAFTLGIQPPAR